MESDGKSGVSLQTSLITAAVDSDLSGPGGVSHWPGAQSSCLSFL